MSPDLFQKISAIKSCIRDGKGVAVTTTQTNTSRSHGMDALRGIAVLLVILQHSNGIPRTYADINVAEFLDYSTGFLAPYRMPMLLLLSGLLLIPSVRKPLPTYYGG
ncbi:hypothetical protein C7K25_01835 [Gulosibacter molinativorax]|uniref:Acyltransferase 3 domain-containing protein n=1 Tax=Gulosibacter molinativorax TaxID=256821 RepID=A0ABT7C5P0_9MICO|nr:hypothetical protein [Gulosibacter molinativorax]